MTTRNTTRNRGGECIAVSVAAFLWLLAGRAGALDHAPNRHWHVPADFASIQEALDHAVDGDSITVSPGTYPGSIAFGAKEVVLRSMQGAETTTLVADSSVCAVSFEGGQRRGAELNGFTITGVKDAIAISIVAAAPLIANNVIEDNQISNLTCLWIDETPDLAPRIKSNVFRENLGDSYNSECVYLATGQAEFHRNLFLENDPRIVMRIGRGVQNGASAVIEKNVLAGEDEDLGQGIYFDRCDSSYVRGNQIAGVATAIFQSGGGSEIAYNALAPGYIGVQLLHGAGSRVHNNTIYGGASAGIVIGSAVVDLRNNLVVGHGQGLRWDFYDSIVHSKGNNLYMNEFAYDGGAEDRGTDTFLPPRFRDASSGDYRLRLDSPLVDLGHLTVNQIVEGPAPDVGAHETLYPDAPTANLALHVHPTRVRSGDTLHYDLEITSTTPEVVWRDVWIEATGKRDFATIAKRQRVRLDPYATVTATGEAIIPTRIRKGPYRIKARYGLFGEEIEASAIANLGVPFDCNLTVTTRNEPSEVRQGQWASFRTGVWNDCRGPRTFDAMIAYYAGPAHAQSIVYDGPPMEINPEVGFEFSVGETVPPRAPRGVYTVTSIAYNQGAPIDSTSFEVDVLPAE